MRSMSPPQPAAEPQAQTCGCKGVRYCKLCLDSDRVRALQRGPTTAPLEVVEPWRRYQPFVYCARCAHAIRIRPISAHFPADRIGEFADEIGRQTCDSHDQNPSSGTKTECPDSEDDELQSFPIGGLTYLDDFISESEEEYLTDIIARQHWVVSQSGRRKQDYGPRVNFKHHKVKLDSFEGMPEYADFVLQRMRDRSSDIENTGRTACGLTGYQPFEMCNLEYTPDRGSSIDFHIDDRWIWGNRLISINLLSGSIMSLIQESTGRIVFINMRRRSLLCMADESRTDWKHGILAEHIRSRRIALTMREPAADFCAGGSLYEKYGRDLIERSNRRVESSGTGGDGKSFVGKSHFMMHNSRSRFDLFA